MFEDSSQYFWERSRSRPAKMLGRAEPAGRGAFPRRPVERLDRFLPRTGRVGNAPLPSQAGSWLSVIGYSAFGVAEGRLRLANSQPILPFSSVRAASNGRPFFEMNPRNTSLLPVASILRIWSGGISRRRIALLTLKVQDRFATFSQM